jgi:hypothetical protein
VQRAENTSTKGFLFNIPYNLGVRSGRQLAKAGGSVIANTIPISGTFGHLFAHPNESIGDKASDIAFGVLDIAGIGDVIQAVKKPVEEGVNVIGNTLAKRLSGVISPIAKVPPFPAPRAVGLPIPPPPKPFILPLPKFPHVDIHPPPIRTPPVIRHLLYLPPIHLPHIDIFPHELDYLGKLITKDMHATVTAVHDLGNKLGIIIEDAVTHLLNVDKRLGKIEHFIVGTDGRLIKVGEYTEGDIANLLGKDLGGLGRGIKGFFGKVNRILHSKPVTYGLLGIAIGAPLAGSLLTTGGTQQQTSPSSQSPSNPSLPPYISPVSGGGGTPKSSQSADVLNPYSPQAQYYSALASQTAQTQPTTTQSTSTSSTTSSKGSLFSNPLLWVGIAIFIIIIVLLVR